MRILPVVHLLDPAQAVAQSLLALTCGANGVFLIHHGGSAEETLRCLAAVRSELPDAWIGVNLLGSPLPEAVRVVASWPVDALWNDNADLDERRDAFDQPSGALLRTALEESGFSGEVFGGVAFKYQRAVSDADLPAAASVGSAWLDVVTTSGLATASGASLEKLASMRSGIRGSARLAVASGVTAETVAEVGRYVDDVLVASSVCSDFHTFDEALLAGLVRAGSIRDC